MFAPEQEDTKMVALPEVKVKVTMSNVMVSQHSTPNGGRVYVINMKYPSNMLLIICAFTIFLPKYIDFEGQGYKVKSRYHKF